MPKHFMRHSSQCALNTWIRQDQKDDLESVKRFIGKTVADQVREALTLYYGLYRPEILGDGRATTAAEGGLAAKGDKSRSEPRGARSPLVVLNTWTYKTHKDWARRVTEVTGKSLAVQVRDALDAYLVQCEREGLLGGRASGDDNAAGKGVTEATG